MTRRITTTMEDDIYRLVKKHGIKLSECLALGAEIILAKHDPQAHPSTAERVRRTKEVIAELSDAETKLISELIRKSGYSAQSRTTIYALIERKVGLPLTWRAQEEVKRFIDNLYTALKQGGEINDILRDFKSDQVRAALPAIDKELAKEFPTLERGKFLMPGTIAMVAETIKRKVANYLSFHDIIRVIAVRHSPYYNNYDLRVSDIERLTVG